MGHRRIAFVGGDPSAGAYRERIRGYRAALERAYIDFDDPGRSSGEAS